EGGMKVILEFLKKGLVDEMNVYIGSIVIGGAKKENEIMNLQLKSYRKIGNGVLLRYGVKK
ncbi:MAG: dihydrofolate reductase family protein, partial [Candidatus Thermoplasmatota archaeon]